VSLRRTRLERAERTNPLVGGLALLLAAVGVWIAFARPNPFRDRFELKAVVTSVNGVTPGITPVRIAGVDVGEVTAVRSFRGTRRSVVTLELEDDALPIHADARVKMRPRLFLEGNSFVELSPGTPAAPEAHEGTTIPLERTSVAVSMPHVLGALTADTRANLQAALQAYGDSLNHVPSALEDATHDPSVHGRSGGQALNAALRHAARALPTSALLSDDTTGRRPGDLRGAVRDFGAVAEGLNDAGPQLGRMLASLREANSAFASETTALTAALEELPGALRESQLALRELRVAMPPARALSAATVDALPALPAMFDAGAPWLGQARDWLGPGELGATLDLLLPATRELAPAVGPTADVFRRVDLLSRCGNRVLVPTANARIEDGPRSAGTSVFAEFLSATVGAGGAAQTFDGNGFMLRGHPGGGGTPMSTAPTRWLREPLYGNALAPPEGTRPAAPRERPPHRPEAPCHRNSPPDLNGPAAAPGPADGSGG
jgi:phospholipid/cholesterol/gamma-HCH transport system substrate-binding protein